MGDERFSFYLRISPSKRNIEQINEDYISNTIYSSLYYSDDSSYKIMTSINPCDSVLLSYAKRLIGRKLNKKMINKDDLYQYHLNHSDTDVFKFSFVFNELLSYNFITDSLFKKETAKTQNIFVFGKNKRQFIEQILISLMNKTSELKLSFYAYDEYSKSIVLVHPSFKNLTILSACDISNSLLNMKNEYKLSIINTPKLLNENDADNRDKEKIIIIVAKWGNCASNFISSRFLSLNKINEIINTGYNFTTSLLLNISEQSDDDIEMIKLYHSMYNEYNANIPQSSSINKTRSESNIPKGMSNEISRNNSKHQILNSQLKDNIQLNRIRPISPNDDKQIRQNHGNTHRNTNIDNDQMISSLQNNYNLMKQEKVVLEKMNNKLANSLDQERKEKLTYINENSMLLNQIKKLKNEITALSSDVKELAKSEQKIYIDLKQKEYIDYELKAKEEQIKTLIEEKSYIEVEYQILNEKYRDIESEYKEKQLQYEESNNVQKHLFKEIEEKIYKLEIELSSFQKDNINLNQINQKQLSQIDTLKKQKEKYYDKYKLFKNQLSTQSFPGLNSNNLKETQCQNQNQSQSQNRLIENLKSKIKQINTESIN